MKEPLFRHDYLFCCWYWTLHEDYSYVLDYLILFCDAASFLYTVRRCSDELVWLKAFGCLDANV